MGERPDASAGLRVGQSGGYPDSLLRGKWCRGFGYNPRASIALGCRQRERRSLINLLLLDVGQQQSNECSRVWSKRRGATCAIAEYGWPSALCSGRLSPLRASRRTIQTQSNYFVEGRIAAVDPTARSVTIVQTDARPRTLSVSPAAANPPAQRWVT